MLWTRSHAGLVILLVGLFSLAVFAFVVPQIGVSFFPDNDRGEFAIKLELPPDVDLGVTRKRALEVAEMVRRLPFVRAVGATVGYVDSIPGQISEGVQLAQFTVLLTPKGTRPELERVMESVRKRLEKFPGCTFALSIPKPTGGSGAELTSYIAGPDFAWLEKYNLLGRKILRESGRGKDVDSSIRPGKPRILLSPKRPILHNLGLEAATLGTSVAGFFDGVEVGTYKIDGRTFDIRVKLKEARSLERASRPVAGSLDGMPIHLDVLADRRPDSVAVSVIRKDKERTAWIYANPAPGSSLSRLMELLDRRLAPELPPGYRVVHSGISEMMREGILDFAEVFFLALALTYLLIAAIMESWGRPFLILFTVPLGFVGLFLALWLSGTSLSMVGMLGGIMMLGIVVNNAILMMDECAARTRAGEPTHAAMLHAAQAKFRPVLMTSIAAVAGMLPMAFGTGLGSELRASCGIGVVGGLTLSAVLTLYLIPALYFKFVRDTGKPKGAFRERAREFFGMKVRNDEKK